MTFDPLLVEWLNLSLRWLHVIAAIAWIGSSFYFIALDYGLRSAANLPQGVSGEAWQVHGGGFYRMQKYTVAPPELPAELTWFKWEAYTTWLSGFALLVALYYWNAPLYLIDPQVLDIGAGTAVAIGIASLVLGYAGYEALCRSPLGCDDTKLALAGSVLIVAVAYAYTLVFSGRGAFMHVGTLLGTCMVASVAMVIIPNQRKAVAELIAGRVPDPALGRAAKQRSLHNNYLTLPVLFLMIANHYPLTFASRYSWLIVGLVLVIGFSIRHFFNNRHRGLPTPWWTWGVAAAGMAAVAWLGNLPPATANDEVAAAPAAYADAEAVVLSRCSMCHASETAWEGVPVAPKGVMLDTPERIVAHAHEIGLQAVRSHAMPPGNLTGITPQERRVLASWIAAGAPAE